MILIGKLLNVGHDWVHPFVEVGRQDSVLQVVREEHGVNVEPKGTCSQFFSYTKQSVFFSPLLAENQKIIS